MALGQRAEVRDQGLITGVASQSMPVVESRVHLAWTRGGGRGEAETGAERIVPAMMEAGKLRGESPSCCWQSTT